MFIENRIKSKTSKRTDKEDIYKIDEISIGLSKRVKTQFHRQVEIKRNTFLLRLTRILFARLKQLENEELERSNTEVQAKKSIR